MHSVEQNLSNIHGINFIVDFSIVKNKIQRFSNVQIIYLFIYQNGLFSFTGTLLQFIFALFSINMHNVLCVLSRWLISGSYLSFAFVLDFLFFSVCREKKPHKYSRNLFKIKEKKKKKELALGSFKFIVFVIINID